MKFRKEHGIIIAFITTLMVPLIVGLFVHNDNSEEKKSLSPFPSTISDSYFDEINSWYNDHAPFRTGSINLYNNIFNPIEEAFRNWLISLDISGNQNHEHVFGEWNIVKEATEKESGLKERICTICAKKEEEVIPQITHVHTFASEWSYDEYEHWHSATCEHTSLRQDNDVHHFGEPTKSGELYYYTCDVCGAIVAKGEGGEHIHIYSSAWSNDSIAHWHQAICEHKDLFSNYEEHSFGKWHVYDEAKGLRAKTCRVCGYDYIEDVSTRLELAIDHDDRPYYPFVTSQNNKVVIGRDGWLYYLGNNSLEYYKATNILKDSIMATRLSYYEKLYKACLDHEMECAFLVLPNKDQVYPEYMPTVEGKLDALKRGQVFNNYIQYHSDLNYTYPLTKLTEAKEVYPTYYQQDSHWNEYGGLIAAQEVFKKLGWEFGDYIITTEEHSGGDLVPYAQTPTVTSLQPKVSYKEEITLERTYQSTYLETFISSNKNGKKVLICGDSYRYAVNQYFAKEGEETLLVHRDLMDKPMFVNFVKGMKKGDIVIFLYVERYDFEVHEHAGRLADMINAI